MWFALGATTTTKFSRHYVIACFCWQVWYPMTVATNSFAQKKVIREFAVKTGADIPAVDFKVIFFVIFLKQVERGITFLSFFFLTHLV